jgi:hypothetical protein
MGSHVCMLGCFICETIQRVLLEFSVKGLTLNIVREFYFSPHMSTITRTSHEVQIKLCTFSQKQIMFRTYRVR